MRWNGFLLASVLAAVTLSGCLGGDDKDDPEDLKSVGCPDVGVPSVDAPSGDAGNGTDDGALDDLNGTLALLRARQAGNGTDDGNASEEQVLETTTADDGCPDVQTQTANLPPVAALVMTADDGAVQNGTTYIVAGQNVTFSAAGSSDDGSVQLAALTVRDSNGTRTVQLYDGGFQDATLAFPHEGPANVTLRVLDDDGEVDLVETMLYVNRVHSLSIAVDAFMPAGGDAGACDFPSDPPLLWQRAMSHARFVVNSGAQWLSAEMTGGSGEFALCDPDSEPLTEASSTTAETERGAGPMRSSPQYSLFGVATGSGGPLTFDVMVHYEP